MPHPRKPRPGGRAGDQDLHRPGESSASKAQGSDHDDEHNLGFLIITYICWGAPYSNYRITGPQNPILIIKAPTLSGRGGVVYIIQRAVGGRFRQQNTFLFNCHA